MAGGVAIVGLGAATPVGRTAAASAAAVRAGVAGFGQHPLAFDSRGEPVTLAYAPWLDVEAAMSVRMQTLGLAAAEEALRPLTADTDRRLRVGLALALPPPRPGMPLSIDTEVRDAIVRTYPGMFTSVGIFSFGHAAGLTALDAGCRGLTRNSFEVCLILGLDSYIDLQTLDWLEDLEQLHGAGPMNNAWGFVPGEGAGAVLVAGGDVAHRYGLEVLGSVLGTGTGLEKNLIKTESVCIGEGLTAAVRGALSGLPPNEVVTDVYCDMNGEDYRADEYAFTALRTKQAFRSVSDFIAPADCWGDVAAASGPLGLTLAVIAGRKGYASGGHALVWASSESGERGAALLATAAS